MPGLPVPPLPPAPTRHASTALLLGVAAALHFGLRDLLTSNELDTLQAARRVLDPDYLAGDWFLGLPQGPRRPFQCLVGPLAAGLPLVWAARLARLLGYALLAAGVARLAARLRLRPAVTLVLGGVFVSWDQGLFGGEWWLGQAESKVAAYGLVLFGLSAWLERRPLIAAGLFGAATTLHVLVGGQATAALAVAALFDLRGQPFAVRPLVRAAAVWGLAAAPGLAILTAAAGQAVASDPPVSWIYVVFRTPHHSDPSTWQLGWRPWARIVACAGACVVLPRALPGLPAAGPLARFGLAATLPCLVGVAALGLPEPHRVLQFLVFRVGSVMLPVTALLLAGAWGTQRSARLPAPVRKWLPRALAAWVLVEAVRVVPGHLDGLRDFPNGGRPALPRSEGLLLADAARWVRLHTPPQALVLASPALESVGFLAARPVVATYKQTPPGHAAIVAWYGRLRDLAGGSLPAARGHALLPALDRRFESLPVATLRSLAATYQAEVLVARRTDLALPVHYRNAGWSVYDVRPPPLR